MNEKRPLTHSILYAADPLCPWCYGFYPVFRKIQETYSDKIRFSLSLGGLRFGKTAEPLTRELAKILKYEWKDAETVTKQPFHSEILNRNDILYDSFNACKATISVQKISPEKTFEYLGETSKSFFYENRNPGEYETFLTVAQKVGIDPDRFQKTYEDKDTESETWADFYYGFSAGISAFPTFIFSDGVESGVLIRGYHTYEQTDSILKDYFRSVRV
ncbi:DsbA family protein [Leptospira gomenensis]|uniref:DsbA family protein n=1 Tax=Leptospira gomenensis TaxID=2484974 RepID=A0A5F1YC13_9LEPT|nr:DsbA family protein [Leptospira gomenensis]TGK34491.1 DsbA family protein [Leptospira gomenensis]TGK40199.1 DsbA family protein [Leptospira gomenensis]TGK41876.1 DsbA family protein [Leptospira gomenensis]TGK55708.1 DsbA family protein [Leptospira gomenensis]